MWLVSSMVEQFDNLRKQVGYSVSTSYQLGLELGGLVLSGGHLLTTAELIRREIDELQKAVEHYGLFGDVGQAINFLEGVADAIGQMGVEGVEGYTELSEAIIGVRKTTALYGIEAGEALTQTLSLVNQFRLGLEGIGATLKEEGINTVREFYIVAKKSIEGTNISVKDFISTIIQTGPELLTYGWRLEDIMEDVGFMIKAMPDLVETIGLQNAIQMMKSFKDMSLGMKIYLAGFAGITGGGPFEVAARFEMAGVEEQLIMQTKALLGLPQAAEMIDAMLKGGEAERRTLELFLREMPEGLQPSNIRAFTEMLPTLLKAIETGDKITEDQKTTLDNILAEAEAQDKYSEKMLRFQKPLIQIIKDYIGGWLREGVKYIFALYHVVATFFTNPLKYLRTGIAGMGEVFQAGLRDFSAILLGIMPEAYPVHPEIGTKEWKKLIAIPEQEDFQTALSALVKTLDISEAEINTITKAITKAREDYIKAAEIKTPVEEKPLSLAETLKMTSFILPTIIWGTEFDKKLKDWFMGLIPESVPTWFSEFSEKLKLFLWA